ncbi:Uncharacterized protein QTN25_009128 [Entamoeba marina]
MGRFKLYKKFIVDAEFLIETQRRSLNLNAQLSKIFSGTTVCITKCVHSQLPSDIQLPSHIILDCHHSTPMSHTECFKDVLKNYNAPNGIKVPYNYCVCLQNSEQVEEQRHYRFPVLTYDQQILKLCSPSPSLKRSFITTISQTKHLSDIDAAIVKEAEKYYEEEQRIKNKEILGHQQHLKSMMKLKKAKGPNPLSMKKKHSKPHKSSTGQIIIRRGTRGNVKEKKYRRWLKRFEEQKNDVGLNEINAN